MNIPIIVRIGISLIVLFFAGVVRAEQHSLLEDKSHCVAYKAKKRMALIRTVDVVGKNCDISAQLIPTLEGGYYLELEAPILSFESGEKERDQDVFKLLKGEKQPNLIFTTQPRSKAEWTEQLKKENFTVKGELQIGLTKHPVEINIQTKRVEGQLELDGLLATRFSAFALKPPKLFFGLGATVKQDLELHFHLRVNRILGSRSVLDLQSSL